MKMELSYVDPPLSTEFLEVKFRQNLENLFQY